MYVTYYRIHFINGQNTTVAECREEEDVSPELIERFSNALPDGLLTIGIEGEAMTCIPANNVLYIEIISEDEL